MSVFDRLVVGCGYLGERVATLWSEQGLRVAVTTRSAERAERLRAAGFTPFVCDVLDPASLARLPAADVLLHAVGFDRSTGQSQREVAVTGLKNLLAATSGRIEKWIPISSTSVYGQREGELVDEDSPTLPTRENGQIVLDAEQVVRESSVNWVILRLAGIYGPQRLLARIRDRREAIPVAGNPDAWLNLIHVRDCVAAVDQAAKRPLGHEIILVADDRPITRREYYETLAKLLQAPAPEFLPDQPDAKGDRGRNKRCHNAKLHRLLLPELLFPTIGQGLPDAIA
ncbi:MAG: SDR family oxidoreductase [Planctomycetaceae bacterium]|nr:SDR family oxidoreductase [Planctomycetaceae bacterium]